MMPNDIEVSYPLSPMQQGMLYGHIYANEPGVDIEQVLCHLHEPLNLAAFAKAWARTVERHGVLRSSFRWWGLAEPIQDVHRSVAVSFEERDWRGLAPHDQHAELDRFLSADRRRGFDLAQAPLMRLSAFRNGDTDYTCVWTFHHIALDGRSQLLVLKEVLSLYDAMVRGQEPRLDAPCPYRDYISELRQKDLSGAKEFWTRRLQRFSAPTPLMIDYLDVEPRPADCTYAESETKLSQSATSALKTFAQLHQVTLNTLFQGAWAILLSRYSGEGEVVFGAVRSGRRSTASGNDSVVGLLMNNLPVRVSVPPSGPLAPWLRELRAQDIALRDFEHTPLADAQRWSNRPPGTPLFQSVLVFDYYLLDSALKRLGAQWRNRDFRLIEKTGYPLTVYGYAEDQLTLKVSYDRSKFGTTAISRMLGHLRTLLTRMAQDPDVDLSQLQMLTEDEQRQLMVEWNNTDAEYRRDICLHQMVENQARRCPNVTAVVFEGVRLTYSELDQRSNQLARYLQKLDVRPEALVGVYMERSLEMVIGMLGILKAGAAYVPLDPAHPRKRTERILEDTGVHVLLTQRHLVPGLQEHRARVLALDTDWDTVASESAAPLDSGTNPENLAYVIYTSGSTGDPKGSMNTHRGICNRLFWMQDAYKLTEGERVLQKTPFSFDVSVWEIFWPLTTGATVVLARPGGHKDPDYLINLITAEKVSVLHFVPSMLRTFLEAPRVSACTSLRQVIASGEALPPDVMTLFFSRLNARLDNLYGPTEAAVDVTYWPCRPDAALRSVPIGRPVANTKIYILDRQLRPVPIGVPGELYIGGVQVGRGYLNRPELTARRFLPDPFCSTQGSRMYKSGDLARYLSDGNIEYLGRIDDQVKIRGFRIEPGEIEACLKAHPDVRDAAVVARDSLPGQKQLVGYVVPVEGRKPSLAGLRDFLAETLPEYMVPSAIVPLEAFPLNANGKLDRMALPAPDQKRPDHLERYVAPSTDMERTVAKIWGEVLRLDRVGVHDNFFDLGGHSLSLLTMHNKLQQVLGITFPVTKAFQYSTVKSLADYMTQGERVEASYDVVHARARRQKDALARFNRSGKDRNGGSQSHE